MTLILGAVAYDPKVVTIWEGFKCMLERKFLRSDVFKFTFENENAVRVRNDF